MSYSLGQFNQKRIAPQDYLGNTSANPNQKYMTPITYGNAKRKTNAFDSGVIGNAGNVFADECIVLRALSVKQSYYFHAKIKRAASTQVFYVYLVNSVPTAENKTQYLKTITVQAGDVNSWVDFETIFTPLSDFDCILFQLQRISEDYVNTRYPRIVYEELDVINNIMSTTMKMSGQAFLKMGVQSHPGLMMCINREEIYIGRTGIYEVKNGVITVNFLSIVQAALENPNGTNVLKYNDVKVTLDEYLALVAKEKLVPYDEKSQGIVNGTNSKCIFNTSKMRAIDAFTVDYMYEEA